MALMVGPHRHPTLIRPDTYHKPQHLNEDNSLLVGYYVHNRTLGEGGFGKVKLATHLKTGSKVAVKMMNKEKLGSDLHRVRTEIESLKVLRHDNIAKLLQVIETNEDIYLVMEYCSGGELFDYLVQKSRLTEMETKVIIRDLIRALAYIHQNGFAHRDLKPENILFDGKHQIKLIDFGLAANGRDKYNSLSHLSTCCGSPAYAAPELLQGPHYSGPAVDVWSAGVLLYALLVGRLPFDDDNLPALYRKIQNGLYQIPARLSSDVRDLITKMLKTNPTERITVEQILRHPWLKSSLDVIETNIQTIKANIDEHVLFDCHRLFPNIAFKDLRQNILNGFGYQTATYWLLKMNKSSLSAINLSAVKSPLKSNRRRSRSVAELANNENEVPVIKVKVFETPNKASPVVKQFYSPDPKKNSRIPVAVSSPKPQKLKQIQSPIGQKTNFVIPNKRTRFNDDMNILDNKSPLKAKQINSPKTPINPKIESTPKKSLLKRILETATPAKSQTPRTINTSNASKNITLTKFTDPQTCIDKLVATLTQKGVQCKQKDFSLRCVLSTNNSIIMSFNLEICKFDNRCVIQRKRLRGDAWSYKKVCEEILRISNE